MSQAGLIDIAPSIKTAAAVVAQAKRIAAIFREAGAEQKRQQEGTQK